MSALVAARSLAIPVMVPLTFSGGSLAPASSCTLSVRVGMTVDGNLINTIYAGDVTSFEGAVNGNREDETLTNAVGAYILKSFSPNPIQVGQESVLSIEIFNTSSSTDLTGMGTIDNLPSGVTIGTTNPVIVENTCGGTLTTGDSCRRPVYREIVYQPDQWRYSPGQFLYHADSCDFEYSRIL